MAFIIHYPDAAANLFGNRGEEHTLLAKEIKKHKRFHDYSGGFRHHPAFSSLCSPRYPGFSIFCVECKYLLFILRKFFLTFFIVLPFFPSHTHTYADGHKHWDTYQCSKPIDSKGKEPPHQFIIVMFSFFFFFVLHTFRKPASMYRSVWFAIYPWQNAYFLCANACSRINLLPAFAERIQTFAINIVSKILIILGSRLLLFVSVCTR